MLHFRAPPVGLGLPPSKLCLLPRRSNGEISLLPRRVGEDGLLPTKEGRRSIIEPRGEATISVSACYVGRLRESRCARKSQRH